MRLPDPRSRSDIAAHFPDTIETDERVYPDDLAVPDQEAVAAYHPPDDMDPNEITHLRPFSREAADRVQTYLDTAIDGLDYGMEIDNRAELFPYDFLVIGDAVGCTDQELSDGGAAVSLFYRPLHIIDDYLDDPAEYRGHFEGTAPDPVTATHVYDRAFHHALQDMDRPMEDRVMLYEAYMDRVDATRDAVLAQDTAPQTPAANLEDEIYAITGAQYGFLADLLHVMTDHDLDGLEQATAHIGATEQLTDDLRDIDEDLTAGTPNYLLEQAIRTDRPLEAWEDTMDDVIEQAQTAFADLGLPVDEDDLRFQAHYPAMREHL